MSQFLLKCLFLLVAVLQISWGLLQWNPKQSGFTITTAARTSYIPGGVVFASLLVCVCDVASGIVLCWRIWHPQ